MILSQLRTFVILTTKLYFKPQLPCSVIVDLTRNITTENVYAFLVSFIRATGVELTITVTLLPGGINRETIKTSLTLSAARGGVDVTNAGF